MPERDRTFWNKHMFVLNDRKVSYLQIQKEIMSDKTRKNSITRCGVFYMLGKILLVFFFKFYSYLLLAAKVEEWWMHGFDAIDVSFDDSEFTCSF